MEYGWWSRLGREKKCWVGVGPVDLARNPSSGIHLEPSSIIITGVFFPLSGSLFAAEVLIECLLTLS